jgi:twitching motility protein PilT
MIASAAVRDCIIQPDKTAEIPELMSQGGVQYGMQTFDQAIMKLHKAGMISFEEAINSATNPDDFDLRLKGITGAADRWDETAAPKGAGERERRDLPNTLGKF